MSKVNELSKKIVERRIPYVDKGAMAFCSTDNMIVDGLRNAWLDGFEFGQRLNSYQSVMDFDLSKVKRITKEEVNERTAQAVHAGGPAAEV